MTIKSRLKGITVMSNNWTAVKIHAALSVTGLLAYLIVQSILSRFAVAYNIAASIGHSELDMIIVLVGGMFAYVICGYLFLKPVKEGSALSVFWLAVVTIGATMLMMLSFVLWALPTPNSFENVAGILFVPFILLNTIGMGILVAFGLDALPTAVFVPFFFFIASFTSPFLLYLGLRLKVYSQTSRINN